MGYPFYCIAYDYSCADWDSFNDHLRDVPWEDIFKLGASLLLVNFVSGIDVYIPDRRYQIKPHSSPWFSAACTAAIVHRNGFFVCIRSINLMVLLYSSGGSKEL